MISQNIYDEINQQYSLEQFLIQVLVHWGWLRHLNGGHAVDVETEDLAATKPNNKALEINNLWKSGYKLQINANGSIFFQNNDGAYS